MYEAVTFRGLYFHPADSGILVWVDLERVTLAGAVQVF